MKRWTTFAMLLLASALRDVRAANHTGKTLEKNHNLPNESARAYDQLSSNSNFRYLITTLGQPSHSSSVYGSNSNPYLIPQPSTAASTAATTAGLTAATTTAAPVPSVLLGSACAADSDCGHLRNSRCVASICSCSTNTVPLSNIACVPRARNFGDSCAISAQCKEIDKFATCYLGLCMCEGIYHVAAPDCAPGGGGDDNKNDYSEFIAGSNANAAAGAPRLICQKKAHLNQTCCNDNMCKYEVWNSKCDAATSRCVCNSGYVALGDHACAPKKMMLGEKCSIDEQCMPEGAYCNNKGQCECDTRQFCEVMGACQRFAALTETCVNNCQCNAIMGGAVCGLDGTCMCPMGMQPNAANTTCELPAIELINDQLVFPFLCCRGESDAGTQILGQVLVDSSGTNVSPLAFAISESNSTYKFNIGSFGVITTEAVDVQNVDSMFLVTATGGSATGGSATDTAEVLVVPAPSATSTVIPTLTASLVPGAGTTMNCAGISATATLTISPAANAGGIAAVPTDLFTMPCGSEVETTFTSMPTPGTVCDVMNGMIRFLPITSLAAGASTMCTLLATATSCTGLVSQPVTQTVVIVGGIGCRIV